MTDVDERQDAQLRAHQRRLEELGHVVHPEAATPGGALQRLLLSIPNIASRLALGSRGRSNEVGPPGIALDTDGNLAARVSEHSILDGDGNVIVHSAAQARLLSQRSLGISSNDGVHLGSRSEDVEITAGSAGFADPSYEGQAKVPRPPEVDTAGPRAETEASYGSVSGIFRALDVASAASTLLSFAKSLPAGASSGDRWARVDTILGGARALDTLLSAAEDALHLAMGPFETDDPPESHAPKVRIHGAGAVKITSPAQVSVYADQKVGVASKMKASVKGGWSASLKSGGNAKVYGVVSAHLKSEGVAGIKARAVSIAGKQYTKISGKEGAVLSSEQKVHIKSDDMISVDAANDVVIAANHAMVDGKAVGVLRGRNMAIVDSDEQVTVKVGDDSHLDVTGDSATLKVGEAQLRVRPDDITIERGSTRVTVEADSFQLNRWMRADSSEVSLFGGNLVVRR